MRLINVDKLEADVEYWQNHDDPMKPDYDTRDIEQVIGFQPIVEAIPVEWIKEKLITEEYPAFVDYIEWSNCLCWLLGEWEEENEKER